MSGAGPEARWTVELTRSAADEVRALPVVVRRSMSALFEELAVGLPAAAIRDDTRPDCYRVHTGAGHAVRFVLRPDDRVVLVFGIGPAVPEEGRRRPSGRRHTAARLGDAGREIADEVRFGVRRLRRAPAFSLGVVLTLAVGLGGAATIFGLVDTVFRGALPFADGDRIVRIRSRGLNADGAVFAFNVTPRDFHLLRDGARAFEDIVAQRGGSVSLLGDGPPERASTIRVTAGWASTLGIRPHLGRTFTPDEELRGEDAGVALISHALWQARFGGDADIIGASLAFDGGSYVIVGVLEPRFAYPYDAQIWTPWRADATNWTGSDLNVVARLGAGVDLADAGAEADRLYDRLKEASPGVAPNDGFQVVTSRTDFIRQEAAALQSLAIAVLFLLLLVCANVANLLAARLTAHARESALRAALGASAARLFRSAVIESLLLFTAGGAVGLLLVAPLGDLVSVLIPDVLRTQLDLATVSVGSSILLFSALASVVAGVTTGVFAARHAARADLQGALRVAGRGIVGPRGGLRDALVTTELALSLVLLVAAGVLADHFRQLQRTDLGFETRGVTTAQVALQHERFDDPRARVRLVEALQETLGALPSVDAVGVTSVNPLCCGDWGARIRIDGLDRPSDAPPITIHHRYVTPEYFTTMRIPIVRGRTFGSQDELDTPLTVIVDQDLADRFWPDIDPIGRLVGLDVDGEELRTVVGVAARAHAEGDERETWYLPFLQEPDGRSNEILHLMVRSESGVTVTQIRDAVADIDPALAVFGGGRMDDLRMERLAQDRMGAVVAGVFAAAGLLLAVIGLYGLLAYQVELRRRELGTRVALGAGALAVGSVIVGRTARLYAGGVTVGSVAAVVLTIVLSRVIEGVTPASPQLIVGPAVVLGIAALLATLVPVRRALASDPARVLQGD